MTSTLLVGFCPATPLSLFLTYVYINIFPGDVYVYDTVTMSDYDDGKEEEVDMKIAMTSSSERKPA